MVDLIAFTYINGGEETALIGEYWSDAPPMRGMKSKWVVVDQRWFRIVAASRRHRCGANRRGRWIDIGEIYGEPHLNGGGLHVVLSRLRRNGFSIT
jgi:hypothetical protein